jgi:tRNA dimethylallyltransferase
VSGLAPRVLAVFGPTAAGKSALAHAAARELGGEVVVADPFQRYRGLEIAADAPRAPERAEVPYHAVGDLAPSESSSAGGYAAIAHTAIDGALARGRVPVVAGGTGLYLRAALADLEFPSPAPAQVAGWAEDLVARDLPGAADALRARDPAAAARVDLANPRRLARALAIAAGGAPASGAADRLWASATRHPTLIVGVVRPRPVLDALIARRVRRELEDGLVAELDAALEGGLSREAAQVIGVREVLALRAGELDASELPDRLAARTRRLARRQLAWMAKTPGVVPLELGDRPAEEALPELLRLWREARAGHGVGASA